LIGNLTDPVAGVGQVCKDILGIPLLNEQ